MRQFKKLAQRNGITFMNCRATFKISLSPLLPYSQVQLNYEHIWPFDEHCPL